HCLSFREECVKLRARKTNGFLMHIKKAIITAAGKNQRTLPLQTLVDRDGSPKTALTIIVEEVLKAGLEEICVVVSPGDEAAYRAAAGVHAGRVQFVEQPKPQGYGHAVHCARDFAGGQPFQIGRASCRERV